MINEHKLDNNGKVVGVHLTVHRLNKELTATVYLINEYDAQGKTICYTEYPKGYGFKPALYTGYQGNAEQFHQTIIPNSDEIPITNAFTPPNLGPLAVGLRNSNGELVSDIVGNLGLPYGHHVSYRIVFEFKNTVDTPDEGKDVVESSTISQKLDIIIDKLNQLLAKN